MEKKQYLNIDKPIGSWMWDAAYYVAEPAGLLEFCSKNGITELYISVNNNVTDMRYADLLRWCTSAGIRVSALTGEPNWIYPDRRQGYYSFLERVAAIQRTCKGAARFSAWNRSRGSLYLLYARCVRTPSEWVCRLSGIYHPGIMRYGMSAETVRWLNRLCVYASVLIYCASAIRQRISLRHFGLILT